MARGRGIWIDADGLGEMGAGLKRGAHALPEAFHDILRGEAGEIIRDELRSRVHNRTGRTAAGIDIRDSNGSVEIGNPSPVSEWLESGVPPHIIRAKGRGALAFRGRVVRDVVHPGFRGQRIAGKTVRHVGKYLEKAFMRELDSKWGATLGGVRA